MWETGELSPQEGDEGGVKLQERCRVLQAGCGLQFWMGLQGKKKSQNLYQGQQSQQVRLGGEGPRLSLTAVQGTGTTCISSLGVVLQACLGYTGTKLTPDIP